MIKSVDGNTSSKRVLGVLYSIVLLILYIYKELNDKQINNPEIFIGMVVSAFSLVGITVFEYFGKITKENKRE